MIRLTFSLFNRGFAAHDEHCPQARTTNAVVLMSERHATVDDARAWADRDESDRAGHDARAFFKVCRCARARR